MKNIKIVSVVDEFHPNAGYTNNVISKYLVKEGYSYDIVTTQFLEKGNYMDSFDLSNMESKDELFTKTNGVKIHRLSCKKHISGRAVWNYKEFHTKINELKPDILFFGGNDTLIFMQFVLKNRRKIIKNKLPFSIVSDSHMLDMASKNKFKKIFYFLYRLFITPIIKKAKIKVIRVQDDDFVMKRLGVPKDQAPFISFGTDTTVFYPDKVFNREERAKLCLDEKDFVVLYAGKINESKGGMLLSDLICGEYNTSKKIVFIVVANASSDYECRVIERIKRSKNKTIIHPAVSYDQLPYYYKIADLAVFPKQCSLSFYDIQACGVPVLLEDNNINKERASHNNGFLYDGTPEGFQKTLSEIVECKNYDFFRKNARDYILKEFDYSDISKKYDKLFKTLKANQNETKSVK